MILGIDASNIKTGGGFTHLYRILEFSESNDFKILLVGGPWLKRIRNYKWIEKLVFEKEFTSLWRQEKFKRINLPNILKQADISLIPGGTYSSKKTRNVSMSQNMLVFEEKERNRFPFSFTYLRYRILEKLQVKSFRNAIGIIYISNYAKSFIETKYPELKKKKSVVIYHGISDDFRLKPRVQLPICNYSTENPLKISYISIINFYKHQWNVIEAVKKLHQEGYPIQLKLIGPLYKPAKIKLNKALRGSESFVQYLGNIPYANIPLVYKNTDLFVFASTCENMPNILVEAMAAGLPILSSSYGPMPEVLRDGGIYMDPTNVESIYIKLKELLNNEELRAIIAERAFKYSQEFSWKKTSRQTFDFLKEVALDN